MSDEQILFSLNDAKAEAKKLVNETMKESDLIKDDVEKLKFLTDKVIQFWETAEAHAKLEPESIISKHFLNKADDIHISFGVILEEFKKLLNSNNQFSRIPMSNFGALHHKEIKKAKTKQVPFTQNEFILELPNRGEINITKDLLNFEELNKIEDEIKSKFPDPKQREIEAQKIYISRNKIDIALSLQRDLGYTPYEEILFMYCFSIADKDGVFIFNPTEILNTYGLPNGAGNRQNLAIALYNIMTKRISGKVIVYNNKVATPTPFNIALIASFSDLGENTKEVKCRGKIKGAIKTGAVCTIFPTFFQSQTNYYAPLEKRAWQLQSEPELLFLLRDFIQIARTDKENKARLSYLNLIYRLGIVTKVKAGKGNLKVITDRLDILKEKEFIQNYKITKDRGKTEVLNNWFEDETILHKGNLNEALLEEYVIVVNLPERLKTVLLEIKTDQKKKIEKQENKKVNYKKTIITG